MMREQAQIIEAVRAGASIDEAARQAGKPVGSVRRWLTAGRKGGESGHAAFAEAVDAARGERKQAERALKDRPLSPQEAELLLARAARKGSVPALRLWFEMRSRDDAGRRGDDAHALLASVFGEDR